jgi:tetratricopeptide (TPR) repeat protein
MVYKMRVNLFYLLWIAALLFASPVRGEVPEVKADSLLLFVQAGDSCMQQYNTFEALKYYQQAYAIAKKRSQTQTVDQLDFPIDKLEQLPQEKQDEMIERLKASAEKSAIVDCMVQMKLADCYYKRGNYRETADLLKLVPEDSLSHDAFRQLCFSYQKQGDTGSYIYWTERLTEHYPMDGEMVAGLTLAFVKKEQPQRGIICGMIYCQRDSTNILVNRALANAWFMNRDFTAAGKLYDRLLQQGDSTFNTLYSAGKCYSQIKDLERAYHYLLKAFLISSMQHYGCAYRLGVVCIDTKRYSEGLGYLDLAKQLMQPDTTIMKAITLSQGEGYYMTEHYQEAVTAWKEHLTYNPTSIATYYNIANAYAYLLKDGKQAESYYRQFLDLARKEEKPTDELNQMIKSAEDWIKSFELSRKPSQKSKK